MEKLSGAAFNTAVGKVVLKQFHPHAHPLACIAYFYTNIQNSKCLLVKANNSVARTLFFKLLDLYNHKIPALGWYACHGETTINGNVMCYILLVKIRKDEDLEKVGKWLTNHQMLILAQTLFRTIASLKEKKLYFGGIHPQNIITNIEGGFNLIGGFCWSRNAQKSAYFSSFPMIKQQTLSEYKYFSPQILSDQDCLINYKSDLFVAGCLLFEIITGQYPFQSKQALLSYQYTAQENMLGFENLFQRIFTPPESRAEPEEILKLLEGEESCTQFKTTKMISFPDKKSSKTEGFKIFTDIEKFFSKLTKQSEGAFLKFTEANADTPDPQNLHNILTKAYGQETKIKKLLKVIERYVEKTDPAQSFENDQAYFLLKTVLIIYSLIRQAPFHDFSLWIPIVETISQKASNIKFIVSFCKIVKSKIQFHMESGELFCGNFFIDRISKYFEFQKTEIEKLAGYCLRMVTYVGKMTTQPCLTSPMKAVIQETCNQLHNAISILLFLILAIKQDNKRGLREDSLEGYKSLQKQVEMFLKKVDLLSQQSDEVSSHPLYQLQTGYHWYQEELYLSYNPQTTTFESFYGQNKHYKGLVFPQSYEEKFRGKQFEAFSFSAAQNRQETFESFKEQAKSDAFYYRKSQPIGRTEQKEQKEANKFQQGKNQPQKKFQIQRKNKQKKESEVPKKEDSEMSTKSDKKINSNNFDDFHFEESARKPVHNYKSCDGELDLDNSDIYSYEWLKRTEKSARKLFKEPQVDVGIHLLCEEICQGLKLKELISTINEKKKYVLNPNKILFDKVIGSGSAGEVYIGKYLQNTVAIKKVKIASNPTALKEFEREVLTYLKIGQHPYLVSLIGLTKFQSDYFLLTQFCEGGSLFDLLHKKANEIPLTWKERIKLALQIAEGMEILHAMKPPILHRDMKSLNVFITKKNGEWVGKVADFGLSRCPDAALMTSALGTLHWMAPELLENKQYTSKIDVYSYGIVLWEICSRRTPYHNLKTPMEIVKHVLVGKQRPQIDLIQKQCPEKLIMLMQRCWSERAEERPAFTEIVPFLKKELGSL